MTAAESDPETYFYLQDANFNVVAVMDISGNVLTQYTYTPYGDLIHVDDLTGGVDVPVNRFTHQGLPFERFYAESGDDLTTDAILVGVGLVNAEFAPGLYQQPQPLVQPGVRPLHVDGPERNRHADRDGPGVQRRCARHAAERLRLNQPARSHVTRSRLPTRHTPATTHPRPSTPDHRFSLSPAKNRHQPPPANTQQQRRAPCTLSLDSKP